MGLSGIGPAIGTTEGMVESISPDTVRRILNNHKLKPWRQHLWLSPKVPRDAGFAAGSRNLRPVHAAAGAARDGAVCR